MTERRIRSDHQIERLHRRRGVHEVSQLFAEAVTANVALDLSKLFEPVNSLKAQELHSRDLRDPLELQQAKRSLAIAPICGVSLPGDADLESVGRAQLRRRHRLTSSASAVR